MPEHVTARRSADRERSGGGFARDLLIGLGQRLQLAVRDQIGQSAAVTDSAGSLNTTRAFEWGIVLVGDSESTDIPALDRDAAIRSSDTAVVVAVRHAQDIANSDEGQFLVEVSCVSGLAGRDDLAFDGHVLVSSGRLSIGDADHQDMLLVPPGRWRLQIATGPSAHSERVAVWFSPAH